MTRGASGRSKRPSERRMGGARAVEKLTESYVRWRSSRLGQITDALSGSCWLDFSAGLPARSCSMSVAAMAQWHSNWCGKAQQ
jgi:hypothetical protein